MISTDWPLLIIVVALLGIAYGLSFYAIEGKRSIVRWVRRKRIARLIAREVGQQERKLRFGKL